MSIFRRRCRHRNAKCRPALHAPVIARWQIPPRWPGRWGILKARFVGRRVKPIILLVRECPLDEPT